jgi:hypothetical protein
VEFIRGGGLEKSRRLEIQELEQQRRALQSQRAAGFPGSGPSGETGFSWPGTKYDAWETGISAAAVVLRNFFRRG